MPSTQEQRHVYYDRDLEIEAYNLGGIVQKFPNHFHEFYVLGFIEGGKRHLWCRGEEYDVSTGDLILFNPRDNHYCAPINGEILDYRAVNINPDVMRKAAREITGHDQLPRFTQNVVPQRNHILDRRCVRRDLKRGAEAEKSRSFLFFDRTGASGICGRF